MVGIQMVCIVRWNDISAAAAMWCFALLLNFSVKFIGKGHGQTIWSEIREKGVKEEDEKNSFYFD